MRMQVFTRTQWYIVPLLWTPIALYLGLRSVLQFTLGPLPAFTREPRLPLAALAHASAGALGKTTACFFLGNVLWTLLEYTLHRFLFHIDEAMPDHPACLLLHFMLHGIHHYLPMDRCVPCPRGARAGC